MTTSEPSSTYELWHDRAAFHFLTEAADRIAYVIRLKKAVRAAGHVIIATFAPDGPEKCSGLPIVRYDPEGVASALGAEFDLVDSKGHDHVTPGRQHAAFSVQPFSAKVS